MADRDTEIRRPRPAKAGVVSFGGFRRSAYLKAHPLNISNQLVPVATARAVGTYRFRQGSLDPGRHDGARLLRHQDGFAARCRIMNVIEFPEPSAQYPTDHASLIPIASANSAMNPSGMPDPDSLDSIPMIPPPARLMVRPTSKHRRMAD
jgi:hypothetical protein